MKSVHFLRDPYARLIASGLSVKPKRATSDSSESVVARFGLG